MAVPNKVWAYSRGVAEQLVDVFGNSLVGVYLHGSGAMGGWAAVRSDVDILAVIGRSATPAEKERVIRALTGAKFAAPGAGLEFSLVARPSFDPLTGSPPFELHIATERDAKVVDGLEHGGDPDLVLHYAVCHERGLAIVGPAPASLFPAVPRSMVLAQLQAELEWAVGHAPPEYLAQNALRAWAYAEEGRMLSKLEGAQWAVRTGRIPMRSVAQGRRMQLGGAGVAELLEGALTALADAKRAV